MGGYQWVILLILLIVIFGGKGLNSLFKKKQ